MFTGIVQACGRVTAVKRQALGVRLAIDPMDWMGDQPNCGDSVCVSGVCLTVVATGKQAWQFDVVAETLARTTLGRIQVGTPVNLETALTPRTPIGGHFVQGHVDGIGRVTRVDNTDEQWRITLQPDPVDPPGPVSSLMEAIVPKGSVAVDGVSLTVAAVGQASFEVALIPTTLKQTTLGGASEGDAVNLETDVVSKTVVHWLGRRFSNSSAVTVETLQRAGFIES